MNILDLILQAYLLLVIALLAASWFHFLRRMVGGWIRAARHVPDEERAQQRHQSWSTIEGLKK